MFEFWGAVNFPELGKAAAMKEGVQAAKDGQNCGERIWFVELCGNWSFVQERYTEIEVRHGCRRQGFEKDVDDHIWVVNVGVKLITKFAISAGTRRKGTRITV